MSVETDSIKRSVVIYTPNSEESKSLTLTHALSAVATSRVCIDFVDCIDGVYTRYFSTELQNEGYPVSVLMNGTASDYAGSCDLKEARERFSSFLT